MTPLLTALSSFLAARAWAAVAFSRSPASTASRVRRIAVLRADLADLLRCRAFSLVLIRFIWDLMFATKEPFQVRWSFELRRARERARSAVDQATSRAYGHPNRPGAGPE